MEIYFYFPCPITRKGNSVYVDIYHPDSTELAKLVYDLMNPVKALGWHNEQGYEILDRVKELAGEEAARELRIAWKAELERKRKASASRKARNWIEKYGYVDNSPAVDTEFLRALYDVGNKLLSPEAEGGLLEVFAYAYQQGIAYQKSKESGAERP